MGPPSRSEVGVYSAFFKLKRGPKMPHAEAKSKPVKKRERKREVRVEVTDKEIKGVEMGTEITLKVKGKVTSARLSEEPMYDDDLRWPGNLEVEIKDLEIVNGSQFEQLAMQDED